MLTRWGLNFNSIMNILTILNDVENRYPVCQWMYEGIHLWPVIRIALVSENFQDDQTQGYNRNRNLFKDVFKRIEPVLYSIWYTIRDYKHNERIHSADFVFVGGNVSRTIFSKQCEYIDQILDSVRLFLADRGYKTFSLEYLSANNYNFPRFTKTNLMIMVDRFFVSIKSRFIKANCSNLYTPELFRVKKYLLARGVRCHILDSERLLQEAHSIKLYSDYFFDLLNKTGARIGIAVCWYNSFNMAFAHACKRIGIPMVDIQHGLAGGNGSENYCSWENVPLDGFNTMPSNFWCWTEADRNAIYNWIKGDGNSSAFVGGNPARLLKGRSEVVIGKADEIENILLKDGRFPILLTLQTGTELPIWLIDYIKASRKKLFWFIRKHPVMDDIQDKILKNIGAIDNVETEWSSKYDLYNVLKHMRFHVTSHSAVVCNAWEYGIKSALVDKLGESYFQDQIREGCCFVTNSQDDLEYVILNNMIENVEVRDSISTAGIDYLIELCEKKI